MIEDLAVRTVKQKQTNKKPPENGGIYPYEPL